MMKTILVSLSLTAAALSHAEAGPPASQLHLVRDDSIVTDELAPGSAELKLLHPESYDSTATADAPALGKPRLFTLIGEHGTCEVATTKRIYVSGFGLRLPHVELVIDMSRCTGDHYLFALDGRQAGYASSNMPYQEDGSAELVQWVERKLGKTVAQSVERGRGKVASHQILMGGQREVVRAYFTDRTSEMLVKVGDRLVARFDRGAYAVGVIHHCYLRDQLVVETLDGLRTVEI
jgi:hypothetical protein